MDRRFRFPSSVLRTSHKPRRRNRYIDTPSEMRTFERMPDILQHLLPATTLACAQSFSCSLNLKHIQFQTSVKATDKSAPENTFRLQVSGHGYERTESCLPAQSETELWFCSRLRAGGLRILIEKRRVQFMRYSGNQAGKIGYIILWLLGVPFGVLLLIFLLRGCT